MLVLDYDRRSYNQRLAEDADQAEQDAVLLGSSTIESGLSDDRMAGCMDDFETGDESLPHWVERDLSSDSAVGGVQSELIRRQELLGDAYPFRLDINAIEVNPAVNSLTYNFCLAVCNTPSLTRGDYTKLPRTFERMAMEYARLHLGSFGKSLHTGWPRDAGLPTNMADFSMLIHQKTGEWWWGPDHGLTDDDSKKIKDAGIDFITWIESPDHRPGKLFITGQCACGNDWNTKYGDADVEKIRRWFKPVSWIQPVKAFCTPYLLVDAYLYEASQQAGLVYDRARFSRLAQTYESELPARLQDDMQECIDLVF